jgi:hypothetical protein
LFLACMVCVEDTFTTAGSNFAARSAKLSGAPRAIAASGAIEAVIGTASATQRPIVATQLSAL